MRNRWNDHLNSKGIGFDPSFAIDHQAWQEIKQHFTTESTVLELGSGLSTWLIQTQGVKEHIVLECSPTWFDAVIDSGFNQRADVRLCELEDIDSHPVYRWKKEPLTKFDTILIDGPLGEVGRNGFLKLLASDLLRPVFAIIVDDTHRQAERELTEGVRTVLEGTGIDYTIRIIETGNGKQMSVIQSKLSSTQ